MPHLRCRHAPLLLLLLLLLLVLVVVLVAVVAASWFGGHIQNTTATSASRCVVHVAHVVHVECSDQAPLHVTCTLTPPPSSTRLSRGEC